MEQTFWFETRDGLALHAKCWTPDSELKKGVMILSHGMTEHIARYKQFAEFLNNQKFIVYGHDHRGHGKTGERMGKLGYFAKEDGFLKTADDLIKMAEFAQQKHPDLPIFLFGHSMGSFLARMVIQSRSDLFAGIILCGTGYFSMAAVAGGRLLSQMFPPETEAARMNSLIFGSYNQKIGKTVTSFDWLSRDRREVEKYIHDPYCGFIPSGQFFTDLMTGLACIHDPSRNKHIRKDLPLLIAGGTADPVGRYGKGIWKTAELYEQAGMNEITVMLFDEARHELLNELNREEIYASFLRWIEKQL